MTSGVITQAGRVLTARLLLGEPITGITHCALGSGDETFVDPQFPPEPQIEQTALRHEVARKQYYRREFLIEAVDGVIQSGGKRYAITSEPSRVIAFFFRFDDTEANGLTIKEYGFFGGEVAYLSDHHSDFATGGLHDPITNPDGQVAHLGTLYQIKHIPDFHKTGDTHLELIGVLAL